MTFEGITVVGEQPPPCSHPHHPLVILEDGLYDIGIVGKGEVGEGSVAVNVMLVERYSAIA